jgi:hypothetical protein
MFGIVLVDRMLAAKGTKPMLDPMHLRLTVGLSSISGGPAICSEKITW